MEALASGKKERRSRRRAQERKSYSVRESSALISSNTTAASSAWLRKTSPRGLRLRARHLAEIAKQRGIFVPPLDDVPSVDDVPPVSADEDSTRQSERQRHQHLRKGHGYQQDVTETRKDQNRDEDVGLTGDNAVLIGTTAGAGKSEHHSKPTTHPMQNFRDSCRGNTTNIKKRRRRRERDLFIAEILHLERLLGLEKPNAEEPPLSESEFSSGESREEVEEFYGLRPCCSELT
ncbi:unnamed protein product [Amoebophrya sp. A25]|nr:unnamed protein product [Amoebophrya sp. A25]|eukprot:GSA25T00003116001.1